MESTLKLHLLSGLLLVVLLPTTTSAGAPSLVTYYETHSATSPTNEDLKYLGGLLQTADAELNAVKSRYLTLLLGWADGGNPFVAQQAVSQLLSVGHPEATALAERLVKKETVRDKPYLQMILLRQLSIGIADKTFGDLLQDRLVSHAVKGQIALRIEKAGGVPSLLAPLTSALAQLGQWDYFADIQAIDPVFFAIARALILSLEPITDSTDRTASLAGEVFAYHLRSLLFAMGRLGLADTDLARYHNFDRAQFFVRELGALLRAHPVNFLPRRLLAELTEQAASLDPETVLQSGLQAMHDDQGIKLPIDQEPFTQLQRCQLTPDYGAWSRRLIATTLDKEAAQAELASARQLHMRYCISEISQRLTADFLLALGVVPLSGRDHVGEYRFSPTLEDARDYIKGVIWVKGEKGAEPIEVPQIGVYLPNGINDGSLPLKKILAAVALANNYHGPASLLLAMGEGLGRMLVTTAQALLDQDLVPKRALLDLPPPTLEPLVGSTVAHPDFITLEGSGAPISNLIVAEALQSYEQSWQASFDRWSVQQTRHEAAQRQMIERLIKEDYLPILQSFGDFCPQGCGREAAAALWHLHVEGDKESAKLLREHLESIDLFGGPATREIWDIINRVYFDLPIADRSSENFIAKVAPGLRFILDERATSKLRSLYLALQKLIDCNTAEDLLRQVGDVEELLLAVAQKMDYQALLGHHQAVRDAFREQRGIDHREAIISGLLEAGVSVLLIPVGGPLFQAVKIGGRAALLARAAEGTAEIATWARRGVMITETTFPTLARLSMPAARLVSKHGLLSAASAYLFFRADNAQANAEIERDKLFWEVNLGEDQAWRHERAGFGDAQCFLITTAERDYRLLQCQERKSSNWSLIGLSFAAGVTAPLFSQIGAGTLKWVDRIMIGGVTVGSYPQIKQLVLRWKNMDRLDPTQNRKPAFFLQTPEDRLMDLILEAQKLNIPSSRLLELSEVRQAFEEAR